MRVRREPRVVVGVAESMAGLQALRYAVAEARRRSCSLMAVRTWSFQVPWRGSDVDQWRRDAAATAEVILREAFDAAMGGIPDDLVVELMTAEGDPGSILVTAAYLEDDLLVVGAPRRRAWRASLFTIARHCTRNAGCPVVVVPPPELARAGRQRALAREIQREARRLADACHPDT